jgi:8-oxo-dGTP pyrophosphatase MutT (NUDIX family)
MLRLAPDDRLELLLIKRAEYGGDPWSGHIALPGGRQEPGDHTLLATVVRETREEIGVDLTIHGSILGELDELEPRTFRLPPIGILPHVAVVESSLDLSLSEEVALAFWVPVAALQDPAASRDVELQLAGGPQRFPSFGYQSHVIWGLTERILRQFLDLLINGDQK